MCFAPQRRALFRPLNRQKRSEPLVFSTFWLRNVLRATTACTFSTSQPPKVVRALGALHILTSKCASRHNSVHFFELWTSKSGPTPQCFEHFDWSATTACTFSTSQLPKVVRHWGVLHILTSKCALSPRPKVVRPWCVLYVLTWTCASRHKGLQFFISHLASWLRTRRFSELTFGAPLATNHWKNIANRDFPTFSRVCIFFSDSFSSDFLSSNFSLLSATALLCFSSVRIVGSLTSKLPSPNNHEWGRINNICFWSIINVSGGIIFGKMDKCPWHEKGVMGILNIHSWKVGAHIHPQATECFKWKNWMAINTRPCRPILFTPGHFPLSFASLKPSDSICGTSSASTARPGEGHC